MRLKLCEEHGTMTNHGLVCLKCRNEEKKSIEQARKDNVRIGAILELKRLKKFNGAIIHDCGRRVDGIIHHSLIDERIEELRQ